MEQTTCALVVVFPSKPFNQVMHNRHLVLRGGGETPSKLDVILERLAPTLAPTTGGSLHCQVEHHVRRKKI
jgi:hypothetical protein